jgi:spore maturation protein CgeB
MRIFLSLYPSGNFFIKGSITWYRNFFEPLVDLGHDVYLLRIDLIGQKFHLAPRSKKLKEYFSQILLETFNTQHSHKPFDLFYSYFVDDDIEPAVIDQIRKAGVLTVNFSCNNTHQFYLTEKIASHFDYNLHSEKTAGVKFKAIGANAIWFQMAANPKFYRPIEVEKTMDVMFIGAEYARRLYYIWNLLENRVNVHVYGPGWSASGRTKALGTIKKELARIRNIAKAAVSLSAENRARLTARIAHSDALKQMQTKYNNNLHLPMSDNEMVLKYNQSKIALGFLEVYLNHDYSKTPAQHLHLREFEAPMCGVLYCTNFSDELAEFYEPDREVVIFRSEYELVDKVKYYLAHPNEADKIRKAGYQRAIKCHTYHRRFEELFAKLFPYKK